MNDLEHLKRLSAVKSSTGIKFLSPAVYHSSHCPLRSATDVADRIEGLSSLLVGMPECATYSRYRGYESEGGNGELRWMYVLDANEVVFGFRHGLTDALRKMDKAGAKAIIILATCVPELIGEDIGGVIHEAQPELSARVTFAMLGHFKNVGQSSGSWKTMEALAGLMDPKEKDARRINVLGGSSRDRYGSMPSGLDGLARRGFSLRSLGPGSSLADFQSAPDAALNLVLTSGTLPLAVRMEQDFGVPYIALHTLYDVEDIDRAYAGLAERLGFAWDGEFKEERQQALDLQNRAKERLKGLRYITATRIDTPLPLAAYLSRLGMEPLLLHLEEYRPEDGAFSEELAAAGHDPWICRIVNMEAELPILEGLSPDLCFGQLPDTVYSLPCVRDIGGSGSGYDRTTGLLLGVLGTLDGTGAPAGRMGGRNGRMGGKGEWRGGMDRTGAPAGRRRY